MKKTTFFFICLASLCCFAGDSRSERSFVSRHSKSGPLPILENNALAAGKTGSRLPSIKPSNLLRSLPPRIIENKGQAGPDIRYYIQIHSGTVCLTASEIMFLFPSPATAAGTEQIRLRFIGADPDAKIEAADEVPGTFNYFLGNEPKKWVRDAHSYQRVTYRELYPGVDLAVEGRESGIKTEYIVGAGADVDRIRMSYAGTREIGTNEKGQLEIKLSRGTLVEDVPASYQIIGGERRKVRTRYFIDAEGLIGLDVGAYEREHGLVIDPLTYATFLGGGEADRGLKIAADGSGNVYVTGRAGSNFPVTGSAYDAVFNGTGDVFITKLNASGTALLYSTYLGGSALDEGTGIAVDASGNALLTGYTESANFPTTMGTIGPYFHGIRDAFAAKLNAAGTGLLYSTYLGGINFDQAAGIAVDGLGNAYLTGMTASIDFPVTAGAFDQFFNGGSSDVFVTKLNPPGTLLLYSTFLGGTGEDAGKDIAADESGSAYVTGYASQGNFPVTAGSFDPNYNGGYFDAFVTKFNAAGSSLVYSTFLGGSGSSDQARGIAVDAGGSAVVTGLTDSGNFPTTPSSYDKYFSGGTDAFVSKLNSTGTKLLYSTYVGGSYRDEANGIAIDGLGNATVTGMTESSNFPTTAGADDTRFNGVADAFVTMINPGGTGLVYSTFLGGSDTDAGNGICADGSGNVFVTGETSSMNFPVTAGAFDKSFNLVADAFVARLQIFTRFLIPFGSLDNGNIDIGNAGLAPSGVQMTIFNSAGGVLLQTGFTIPAKGVVRSWDQVGNIYSYGKPVTVEITGDQSLVGNNIKWADPPYETVGAGFTCGPLGMMKGRLFYFPFSSFGGSTNGYAVIANTSDSAAKITIEIFNNAGSLRKSVNFTIGGRGIAGSWDYLGSIQAVADPALLRITSDRDVVVEAVRWEQNKRGWGFAIFPSASGAGTQFLIPFGSLNNGNINLGNTGSSPAHVSLKILSDSGYLQKTSVFTIAAKGVVRSWDFVGNVYDYGKLLAVEITSDQPLVGDNIKWANPPYDTVGAGFSCGPLPLVKGKEFCVPFSFFGSANAYCVIANATSTLTTLTIEVYDTAGALKKSTKSTLYSRSVVRTWDIIGSIQAVADPALVRITATQDVVVEAARWEQNKRGWGFAILPVR